MNERNIHLHISYDGSRFHGWQKQATEPSIQGEMEKCLETVFKHKVSCQGAGRTDAGAHALDYSAHFRTSNHSLPLEKMPLALNRYLPPSIRVLRAREASPDFHSRFSATAREYIYHIQAPGTVSPFWSPFTYYYPFDLDIQRLREILPVFTGEHDFHSFCYGYGSEEKNTIRQIYYLRLSVIRGHFVFTIKGNGFLQGMIRSVISVCLNYMQGRLSREEIQSALDRGEAIEPRFRVPVPAQGLFFKRAYYPIK